MGRLAVPLEQGESSSALVLTDMVLNPQPTNQPDTGTKVVFWRICYDRCKTLVSGVLTGRGDTLWLVDSLLIDTFVIFFYSRHFSTAGMFTGYTSAAGLV